jgi:hypothetical protein
VPLIVPEPLWANAASADRNSSATLSRSARIDKPPDAILRHVLWGRQFFRRATHCATI